MKLLLLFNKIFSGKCKSKDPIDYSSTLRRLYRTDSGYCSYYAGYCSTVIVMYNSTTRRLYKTSQSTPEGQRCPDYVDYDSTTRRLKVYRGVYCGVT